MLPVTGDALRISLHVLAATVWVGGQIVLAGVVPVVRPAGPDVVSGVARRFQTVAWPAYGVLLATGVWNLFAVGWADATSEWQATVFAKLGLVALSGMGAFGHTLLGAQVRSAAPESAPRLRALSGAAAGVGLLAGLGALLLGVLLRGS
ncbi:MAG: hypothetical protein HYU28_02100 [Actinobacteria bacterium]|nr:hypothetical protein [Actinomycetota bacterium]